MNKKVNKVAANPDEQVVAIEVALMQGKTGTASRLAQDLIKGYGWVQTSRLAMNAKNSGKDAVAGVLWEGLRDRHKEMAARNIPHDPGKCPHSPDNHHGGDIRPLRMVERLLAGSMD